MTYYGNATTPISSSFSCKNNNNELLSGDYLHNNNISSCNNTNYLLLSLNKGKIEFSKFSFDNPLISNEGMPQYDDGSLKARWAHHWILLIKMPPKTPEITPEMTPPDNKGNNNNEDDPNNQKNNSGNKLSGGAIAGIVIGVIVVIAVCIAAFIIIRKRKSSSTNTDAGDEV
ncbi:hypothetical protein TVAG_224240 [Trichomonas vaginalis G3]|uniref:Uncharacterized protein n=1 Tax=Trichomonas vaginalis (strain ATCC PRA-98 / G3) TaxID=412133 RepID=A2DW47_TRIV3|nr:hypothetical protein TVAGG3_0804880 [Trichomonas vaginalis G3]EAY15348.1 hypothetical protein TVAG_224240 [Trichomonas vaginalis G3]KAI5496784.1 hypothetical protein TVAGG3_0804880 [Trichomonas vaginalis G3]|eukprot:XP_001327571.1 hypothetical protein [Trichomonas vaginalis G3]